MQLKLQVASSPPRKLKLVLYTPVLNVSPTGATNIYGIGSPEGLQVNSITR
jgi:hypothetical protein